MFQAECIRVGGGCQFNFDIPKGLLLKCVTVTAVLRNKRELPYPRLIISHSYRDSHRPLVWPRYNVSSAIMNRQLDEGKCLADADI